MRSRWKVGKFGKLDDFVLNPVSTRVFFGIMFRLHTLLLRS